MEAFPSQFCKGIRSYWRSRKYQKLKSSPSGYKTGRVTRLGGGARGSTRRFIKLRSIFRIRIRALNPIRILARIRDAYVDAMLGVASKGSGLSGPNGPKLLVDRRIPKSRSVKPGPTEFEKRLIQEIYKSVMDSKEFQQQLQLHRRGSTPFPR